MKNTLKIGFLAMLFAVVFVACKPKEAAEEAVEATEEAVTEATDAVEQVVDSAAAAVSEVADSVAAN